MSALKITTIRLENGDGMTIDLTLQEAKELCKQLEDLFRTPAYVPFPAYPPMTSPPAPWRPSGPQWTCGNSADPMPSDYVTLSDLKRTSSGGTK